MLVECTTAFVDLAEGRVRREAGERFEVSEERYAALNSTKYGQLVKQVEPEQEEPTEEPKPKRRTRKKAEE